jgi:hypothetical protein
VIASCAKPDLGDPVGGAGRPRTRAPPFLDAIESELLAHHAPRRKAQDRQLQLL